MLKRLLLCLNSAILLFLITSCDNKTSNQKDVVSGVLDSLETINDSLNKQTQYKYDYVISNIPIPFETLDKLFKSDVTFNKQFLNSTANISQYVQNNSKALNLGIYGADLTYVISFEQFNEISPYLKSSKKIADDLGIPLAFNKETLERYDANRNNKDSLESIIYGSYSEVDRTLKTNERISLAALVVTGGWIESFFLTTNTLDGSVEKKEQKEVYKIIRQQKFHLNNIINLLTDFNEDIYFAKLINDLNDVKIILDNFSDVTDMNEEEINVLAGKVARLRNNIIEGM